MLLKLILYHGMLMHCAFYVYSQLNSSKESIVLGLNTEIREDELVKLMPEKDMKELAITMIPNQNRTKLKGRAGNVGIIGGSVDSAGPPYFAGIAAHYGGADSVYIFTVKNAVIPIKSFSKELIVLPYLDSENGKDLIISKLQFINSLIIGPGLIKNDKKMEDLILSVIQYMKENDEIPIIFDDAAIYLFSKHRFLMENYDNSVYVTPNADELETLFFIYAKPDYYFRKKCVEQVQDVAQQINRHAYIVVKGQYDKVVNGYFYPYPCCIQGSWRRCSGQGDILTGLLGLFSYWADLYKKSVSLKVRSELIASYAACAITKLSCRKAFDKKNRSMLTSDMANEIQAASAEFFQTYE